MKAVLIKWRKCDPWEKRQQRRAAVRNAWKTIRQQNRLQLQKYLGQVDWDYHATFPVEFYYMACLFPDEWEKAIEYHDCDDYLQPMVRLGWFD